VSPLTAYVVETLVTLLGVVALAVLVLYGARRLGVGRPGGPIELVGRLPLDGRRAIYLVRVGETVYVLGASEAGLTKLGEQAPEGLDLSEPQAASFGETLQRVLGRAGPAAPSPRPRETPGAAAQSEPEADATTGRGEPEADATTGRGEPEADDATGGPRG
jgi:flagellar protein FliO/FliZ